MNTESPNSAVVTRSSVTTVHYSEQCSLCEHSLVVSPEACTDGMQQCIMLYHLICASHTMSQQWCALHTYLSQDY